MHKKIISKNVASRFDTFGEVPTSIQTIDKPNVICCGVLERMQLGWMKLEDGTRCMPYIRGNSDENMYRVNNCPSCGKYVRDVMVEP